MKKTYKYRFDHHTYSLTIIYIVIFVLLSVGLYFLYEGGYLSAWFTSFIVALIALMSLSIPRKIVLDDQGIHIFCLLDLTELRSDEIASARTVGREELKGLIPFFGGYGFFGYYGHFFDLKNLERVRIYASEWQNFVEITDIYENRIYVSCSQAEEITEELQELIKLGREEHTRALEKTLAEAQENAAKHHEKTH